MESRRWWLTRSEPPLVPWNQAVGEHGTMAQLVEVAALDESSAKFVHRERHHRVGSDTREKYGIIIELAGQVPMLCGCESVDDLSKSV